jgi:hypothetical protein
MVTGPGGGSGHIHNVRRTSSRPSGPPELPSNLLTISMGPSPAPQPGFVVLGCLTLVGELDAETQLLKARETLRVAWRRLSGERSPAMGLHFDLDADREGEHLPGGQHEPIRPCDQHRSVT